MRTALGLVAVLIITASGIVHGQWTGRWSRSRALEAAVQRLSSVPLTVGDWTGQDSAIDPRALESAGAAGSITRRYVNRRDGESVNVFLLCGRPGPIAVHRPEVCYFGLGYELTGPRTALRVEEGASLRDDAVWVINLEKSGTVGPVRLRTLYAWGTDGSWKASDIPRLDFADAEVLFKLYVVRAVGNSDEGPDDAGVHFLRQFLPVLRQSLFAGAADKRG